MDAQIEIPQIFFSLTLVTDLELKNGKKTQILTIFNNQDVEHEEVTIGLNTAINRQSEFYKNIKSAQHTLCSIKSGKLKPFMFFDKVEYN